LRLSNVSRGTPHQCRLHHRSRRLQGPGIRASPTISVLDETSSPVGEREKVFPLKEGYVPGEAGSPGRKGPAVRLSSRRSVLAEALRPAKGPRLSSAYGRCDRENGEGKREIRLGCVGGFLKQPKSRALRLPEGDPAPVTVCSRTTVTGAGTSSRGRDWRQRGARRMRSQNSAVPSGLDHRPRAAPPGQDEENCAHRPVLGLRARSGRRARSPRRGGATRS